MYVACQPYPCLLRDARRAARVTTAVRRHWSHHRAGCVVSSVKYFPRSEDPLHLRGAHAKYWMFTAKCCASSQLSCHFDSVRRGVLHMTPLQSVVGLPQARTLKFMRRKLVCESDCLGSAHAPVPMVVTRQRHFVCFGTMHDFSDSRVLFV